VRVISGTLRGRRLIAPPGMATRPTTDRIRESLFNILAGSIQDRRVLDLFAGTGALGIEAISRGAASAVFVDQARAALAAIRRNIRDLGLDTRPASSIGTSERTSIVWHRTRRLSIWSSWIPPMKPMPWHLH
jgi:16S rRNA (guanine966-N2)-methyltransferase